MNMPQCIHPSFDGHLSSFLFPSVMSNATMNILFMVFAYMYLMFCPIGIELIIYRKCCGSCLCSFSRAATTNHRLDGLQNGNLFS